MKIMKLIFAIPLFTSILLIGCGDNSDNKKPTEKVTTSTEDSESKTTLKEHTYISPLGDDAPVYKVDMMPYVPFHMLDKFDKPFGYDVDLIRAIGEEAGFKVDIIGVKWANIFDGVKSGKKDIAISGLSLLQERVGIMTPSKPYLKGTTGYLVKADTAYDTQEKLIDKRIAVLENSSLSRAMEAQGSTNLVLKPEMFLSIQALFTGEADAVFGFESSLLYEAKQFSDNPSKFIPNSDKIMIVAYGKPNDTTVINKFNEGFDKIVANGRFQKINEKWFGDLSDKFQVK